MLIEESRGSDLKSGWTALESKVLELVEVKENIDKRVGKSN